MFNEWLDDTDDWHVGPFEEAERDRRYDHLCSECYSVIVEGEPETRKWVATE